MTSNDTTKAYDLVLFGATGFTGKLAVEYLLRQQQKQRIDSTKWAICVRNEQKAQAALDEIVQIIRNDQAKDDEDNVLALPTIEIATTVCNTPEEKLQLQSIVRKTRIVLTTVGPYDLYGKTLVELCATEGVHYIDITGETEFVRHVITEHDATARSTGAIIIHHAGNDCIPYDCTVYEIVQLMKQQGFLPPTNDKAEKQKRVIQIATYSQLPPSASFSGGTFRTAVYQLGKKKKQPNREATTNTTTTTTATTTTDSNATTTTKPPFDPLYTNAQGEKTSFPTKISSPKQSVFVPEFQTTASPWIMTPVFGNCIRRTNALMGYGTPLEFSEGRLDTKLSISNMQATMQGWWQTVSSSVSILAGIHAPGLFGSLLPKPGDGPPRPVMEQGYLIVYGRGSVVVLANDDNNKDSSSTTCTVRTTFHFKHDTSYFMTAQMLVECGLLLLEQLGTGTTTLCTGGVVTPVVAFGGDLTKHLTKHLNATFTIEKEDDKTKQNEEA